MQAFHKPGRGFLLFLVVPFLFFAPPFSSFAAGVTATGTAKVFGNDTVTAREQALRNAQRNAIEQSIGVYIDSGTVTENWRVLQDKIFSSSKGFIASYDVLEDRLSDDGSSWLVRIEAEVDDRQLTDNLAALEILHKKVGNVRYAITEAAQTDGGINVEILRSASTKISEEFTAAGFRLFLIGEPGFDSLPIQRKLRVAAANNIEMLVEFELRRPPPVSSSKAFFKVFSYPVRMKVFNVSTGQILSQSESAQRHFVKSGGGPFNNREHEVGAVRKSAAVAAQDALKDIVRSYRKKVEGGHTYVIIFQNHADESERTYAEILESMDGFENLKEVKKLSGLLSVEYTSRLPLGTVRKRLESAAAKEGVPLKIKTSFGNRLIYVKR